MISPVELLVRGIEADQVITLLIFQRVSDAKVEVVVVDKGAPARFARQENQPILRFEVLLSHPRKRLSELRPAHPAGVVRRRGHERLQSLGVERINNYARTIGQIGKAAHPVQDESVVAVAPEQSKAV